MSKVITNVPGKLDFVRNLSKDMDQQKFMLTYYGRFSQKITKSFLALTERKMEQEGTGEQTRKKVFNVIMECLQNLCKHVESPESINQNAVFMVSKTPQGFLIYSGNQILNEKVNALKNKLEAINAMDKDELKELFLHLISSTDISESGGAGLGLIDIAKKTGNKLEYDFAPVDEHTSYFSLRTLINYN